MHVDRPGTTTGLQRAAALSLLATALAAQGAPAPTEGAFDEGLAAVHALMKKAKWGDARKALTDLVAAHSRQVYVQARAEAIAEDLGTCAFHAVAKPVTINDVMHGKIASYDARSGKIKVVYADDFSDWQEQEDFLVSPIVFAGPYTITASRAEYPKGQQSFRLCFDIDPTGDGLFLADFGFVQQDYGTTHVSLPASLTAVRGAEGADAQQVLAREPSPAKPGRPCTMVVRVAEERVEMLIENKSVVKVKRDKTEFGQVGIWKGSCDQIVLEGRMEPAFVQGRIDEGLNVQRAAFDQTFDAKRELPAWLFERPHVARTMPRSRSWVPGCDGGVSAAFNEMLRLVNEGKDAEAGVALAGLSDGDAASVARTFVAALLALRAGDPERTVAICDELLADEPEQSPTKALRAHAYEALGRDEDAAAELEAVVHADPGFFTAWEQLCVLRLHQNRQDDARALLREAKHKHGMWDEAAPLERMLVMAERGPRWPRRYSYQSPHYEVVSDIDRKMCIEACRVLEESYVNLMAQLTWIKEDKSLPRFRVFLFSGESSYQEYNKAIVGSVVPHTAGLYTPILKQLLIWNLPRRDDMVLTIRHEGFHQFLDRLMPNPPTWFNEGMAEFWETARREQGRLQGGQVRPDHLATLARNKQDLPKLERFVRGGSGDFYANAEVRYAQAWALVHFLRKGPRAYTARFDALWTQLRTAKSTSAAIDAAFAGVDWAKLEQDFWAHLASLH